MSGMADIDDGDAFFDDDFPDIPDDEFHRLEQDAITFTQQDPDISAVRAGRPLQGVQNVPRTTRQNPSLTVAADRAAGSLHHGSSQQKNIGGAQQNSSGGTFLDEDGLPLVVEERPQNRPPRALDEISHREQWRVNRFAEPQAQVKANQPLLPSGARQGFADFVSNRVLAPQPIPSKPTSEDKASSLYRNVHEDDLRAKIADLLREKEQLATSLRQVQDEVYARRGEVTNLRAKQSAEEKSYQRQIAAIQKTKHDELERHTASLQAVNADAAQIASENQFLKQELKEESRKVQAYQRQLKEQPLTDKTANITMTPKRNHALSDGFDDDEMIVMSPVKSGGRRSKQNTPTANRKRKKPTANESSIQPLPLRLSGQDADTEKATGVANAKADPVEVVILKDRASERHLRLIQKVTDFRPTGSQQTLIELLFQYALPSDTKRSFGSIVIDRVAKLEGNRLPGDLIQIFLDLWSKAKDESYYTCTSLLIEIISYVLDHDPLAVDASLLTSILPIIVTTVEINATTRFKLTRKDNFNAASNSRPVINPDIDNTACLGLLYKIVGLISDDHELTVLFWRSLSTDFVLVMLTACQPIQDTILMMHILTTAILEDTFGLILDTTAQNTGETYICNALGFLLWEIPKPDANKPPYSQKEICVLRQECLNLLAQLTLGSSSNPFNPEAANNHGTKLLINHPTAISRLVRFIYDELATAYNLTPTHDLHIRLVNTAVKVLHFVLLSPAGRQISWQDKIGSIVGGTQKFRVAMARLFYAEGTDTGIDAGITEDTAGMATELLDEIATPDEVEDLVRVFEGEGNHSSKRVSAISSTQRSRRN